MKKPVPKEPANDLSGKFKVGKLFAWFELQRELEQGSMGTLWLAQDYSFGRQVDHVTLRVLPERFGSDSIAVEKLKSEIQRRTALNHPNILHIYGVVESKGEVAIQMEYLEGQSLANLRLTRQNVVFEVRDLEKWVKELCEALEYADREVGLIHGDLRPGNLVVDASGKVKLKDFGIEECMAASMGEAETIPNAVETLPYWSPQRAAGKAPAVTDDIYSLGATLYELLTGKPPFEAGEHGLRAIGNNLPSMAERRAELGIQGDAIPQNWEETVAACLAKVRQSVLRVPRK